LRKKIFLPLSPKGASEKTLVISTGL